MLAKIANEFIRVGSNKTSLFARRFFSNNQHYSDSYSLIKKFKIRNPMFWNDMNEAVKQVEQAERSNTPLTNYDLEAIQDLRYALSRNYDHPSIFEELEPLYSVLNKADDLVKPSNTPKY